MEFGQLHEGDEINYKLFSYTMETGQFIPKEYTMFTPETNRDFEVNPLDDPKVAEIPMLLDLARMVGLRANRAGRLE